MRQRELIRALVAIIVGLVIWVLLLLWLKPIALASEAPQVDQIERALIWIVTEYQPNKRHPIARRPKWRRELAGYIDLESERRALPWPLVTAIIFRESSMRPSAKGDIGEVGLMQVADDLKRICKAQGLDLLKPHDQIKCGTWWLADRRDHCGDLKGAFAYYASGRVCKPDTNHLKDVVRDRFKLAERLEKESAAGQK